MKGYQSWIIIALLGVIAAVIVYTQFGNTTASTPEPATTE